MTPSKVERFDVLVIGSGMAGISAARLLHKAGCSLIVLDKGRRSGGRLASWAPRGAETYVYDFGAQFFTARDAEFIEQINDLKIRGFVVPWFTRTKNDQSEIAWRGAPGMRSLVDGLGEGLTIRQGVKVSSIARTEHGWRCDTEDDQRFEASILLMTAPMPQSLALLQTMDITAADTPALKPLAQVTYAPSHAVMAILDGPSAIPEPGYMAFEEGPVAWLADNHRKGLTDQFAITVHATATYSAAHFDEDRKDVGRRLLAHVQPHLGREVVDLHVHRWKFSQSEHLAPGLFFHDSALPGLWMAGDAFGGPRVEGAYVSGRAAGEAILKEIR